jgi:aminoglycoside phosphotransferase family enzyme/predicted kinase
MKYNQGLIKFLSDPSTYGLKNKIVEVIQTHASYVFIARNYVYKLKKPVDFGFLDFSTLGKRKYYCEQEVYLNSRLSDSYLGVIQVNCYQGNYSFQKSGDVVDYIVKMKRIPAKYFMKNLLNKNKITKTDINKIIRKLYEFYGSQAPSSKLLKYGRTKDIRNTLKQNRALGEKFVGKTISKTAFDTIKYFNDLFLKVNKIWLEGRVKNGYIKDCHGDLHLEHIIIRPKEIEIIDCIEFNNNFRFIDYLCDIAFLSMDLDFHGCMDLSRYFVNSILDKMEDDKADRLVDFYKCYRAYVRGKVGSIRSEVENMPKIERQKSQLDAKKYFRLSLKYALFGSDPVVIVVFGLIASGKTTVAGRLSSELGCNIISSDVVRKQLADIPLTQRAGGDGFYKGLYSRQMTNKTYSEIFKRGKEQLDKNNIVILDASFSKQKFRDLIGKKAKRWNAKIFFIETLASDKLIRQRLLDREKTISISDARIDLLKSFKQKFESTQEVLKDIYFKTNMRKYPDPDKNIKLLFREIIKRNLLT